MGYKLRFIGSFLVILSVYYFWKALRLRTVRKSFEKQYGCQKPAKFRHKDPFLGSDFFNDTKENIKKSRALENWSDRFAKYGSTFSVNLLGSPGICTLEPSNVQTVLATNFKDYGLQQLRRSATLPFLGEGIFTMDGAFWQHSRNLMRPTFTKTNVANLAAFEINLQRFFLLVPEDGSTVDLKPLLRRLFIDTSTEFLFGESMNTLSENLPAKSSQFLEAWAYGQRGTGQRLQLGKLAFLYQDKKFKESIKIAHQFAEYYVHKAIEFRKKHDICQSPDVHARDKEVGDSSYKERLVGGGKTVLLHDMAMQIDNKDELRCQIMHVFLAGHESSAITIGNALFQLSRNPQSWAQLRIEVLAEESLNTPTSVTFDKLKSLRYLQSIIKETLRLYPVASTATRKAYKDTVLPSGGGQDGKSPIFVQQGTTIIIPLFSLHRLAECWQPDPEVFRPERWAEPGFRPGANYIPFGLAPRTCVAQNLAEVEIAYTLARMAQRWETLECKDDVLEWVEELRVSTSSKNGTKVGVRRFR